MARTVASMGAWFSALDPRTMDHDQASNAATLYLEARGEMIHEKSVGVGRYRDPAWSTNRAPSMLRELATRKGVACLRSRSSTRQPKLSDISPAASAWRSLLPLPRDSQPRLHRHPTGILTGMPSILRSRALPRDLQRVISGLAWLLTPDCGRGCSRLPRRASSSSADVM